MVLNILMTRTGNSSNDFLFEAYDEDVLKFFFCKNEGELAKLFINKDVYILSSSLKKIKRKYFELEYPLSIKKEYKLGSQVIKKDNKQVIAEYYKETAIINKKWIFTSKLKFNVYIYNKETYLVFKIKPMRDNSYYYCVKNADTQETVAILECCGVGEEKVRGKIYLKDDSYLLLSAIITSSIMTKNIRLDLDGRVVDSCIGKCAPSMQEERRQLDVGFLNFVRHNRENEVR